MLKVQIIDYKDIARLRRYISDRYRMEPRRKTGVCARHQRSLSTAIKRARHIALVPFTPAHVKGNAPSALRANAGSAATRSRRVSFCTGAGCVGGWGSAQRERGIPGCHRTGRDGRDTGGLLS